MPVQATTDAYWYYITGSIPLSPEHCDVFSCWLCPLHARSFDSIAARAKFLFSHLPERAQAVWHLTQQRSPEGASQAMPTLLYTKRPLEGASCCYSGCFAGTKPTKP